MLSAWLEFRPETVSDTDTVPLKINICFFSGLFIGLVIFQSPLFPDEVGPYAEFQRSLIS